MINPHSREGNKFVITTTKFTTKWVEAIPMKSITQTKIIAFLIKNIIIRFVVPQRLIMENSPNFKGKDMKAFYKKFHIAKTFSFIYYLQGNGLSEATNKIIKIILTKI